MRLGHDARGVARPGEPEISPVQRVVRIPFLESAREANAAALRPEYAVRRSEMPGYLEAAMTS